MNTITEGTSASPAAGYDRDLLRAQVDVLRQAASTRARLENEIEAEHETVVTQARDEAERKIAATLAKYSAEIDATRKEYAALLERADAHQSSEQKKLDDQRKAMVATISKACEKQLAALKEEDQFEELSCREGQKEKLKTPVRLHAKADKEVAGVVEEIRKLESDAQAFLAKRGVEAAAYEGEPAATDGDVLAAFKSLREKVQEGAKAIRGLPAAESAFGGGLVAAAMAGPLVVGLLAAGAAFYFAPGEIGLKAGVAGGTFAVLVGIGMGAGFWLLTRFRGRVRDQLRGLHDE
ncbi:MAG: hypothetical protein EBR23_14495, partial [Planctomycetia bacterium]|nr:hypothetical protein [Planctomycetia bacterium]